MGVGQDDRRSGRPQRTRPRTRASETIHSVPSASTTRNRCSCTCLYRSSQVYDGLLFGACPAAGIAIPVLTCHCLLVVRSHCRGSDQIVKLSRPLSCVTDAALSLFTMNR
ncbi:hypothetical protein BV25DRAFT_1536993 [Artomyces pyxidatus]|uniref:Uncharacterized protein n=1 Tax=Artomyces pyxidatus TaxID=48021 RepID=A0ACB8SKC1_9AGAM|nr:hypothetical protein BV25DRAFT_1536993 [Artomyces pyxidatus]